MSVPPKVQQHRPPLKLGVRRLRVPFEYLVTSMKFDSDMRSKFKRQVISRLSTSLSEIGRCLGVKEYKASSDFKTEVLQSLGVGYYAPGTSLNLAFSEGGDLTTHPWCLIALSLEFHNRSQSRFRKLSMHVSVSRFGSKYKVRGTVGWTWPLRVKYETGYNIIFPFSVSDAKLFEEHLARMESIFISTARRSLQRAA
jgi:hypothetical protein